MKIILALCAVMLTVFNTANAADPAPYGRLPAVDDIRLSPSGERYAFLGDVKGKRMIVVASAQNVLFASVVGDLKVRSIAWAGEDHLLMLLTKSEDLRTYFGGTFELATVLRINLTDKSMSRIFEGSPDIAQRVFGEYGTAVIDGKAYGYFGGITLTSATGNRAKYVMTSSAVDLYRVDLDTGKASLEAHARPNMSSRWLITPDGKVAATAVYEPKAGLWRLVPGESRDAPVMQKTAPLADIQMAGLGRTPGTVLVLDTTEQTQHLFEVKLSDGVKEELYKNEEVLELLHDPGTGLLIGAKTAGHSSATFFDPKLDARWKGMLRTFPGVRIFLQSVSRNLDHMIVKSEGGRDSGTYWLVDTATGMTTPIGNSYPEIRAPQVGPTQLIEYDAGDGLKIEAVLTLPPDSAGKNLPLVVMPHGGPIGVSDHIHFDWWAQAFAANGYAVLQPNYRGSSGYTVEFRDAGYGQWGKKMLTDISDGVAALAQRGTIDPKRVCIVGASYGGYAALAGVTLQQGIYRCAVSVSGVSDVRSLFRWEETRTGHDPMIARYREAITGSALHKDDNGLDDISPVHFAARADAPVLLIHGKDDTVVPITQSGAMESALQSAHKPVEFVRMDGEDHWMSREATRTTMVKESLAFVMKHNPPDEPPASAAPAR